MRTTVGPLPAAVYWRRRFLVLVAALAVVLATFMACSGSDEPTNTRSTGSTQPLPADSASSGAVLSPEVEPTDFEETGPPEQPLLPDPADVPVDSPLDPSAAGPLPTAPVTGPCTDAEMQVVSVPARTAAKRGQPVDLRLRIRNGSTRTCSRDVGAAMQEIYIKQGAHKVWSSDVCSTAKDSAVRQFGPNAERVYGVTWNGRTSTRCSGGAANGPLPASGEYQVFGRLGAKVSEPVTLTITA